MAKKKKETAPEVVAESNDNDDAFLPAPVTPSKVERPKGETLTTGADFFKFSETNPVFCGKYVRPVLREKDGKNAATNPNEKAGSIMGYLFVSADGGKEVIIGNSKAIEDVLKVEANKKRTLWIEWTGKTDLGGGKTFNRFHIQTVNE